MSISARRQLTTAVPLNDGTLESHAGRADIPTYDRHRLKRSIVHIGMGNFHRAHQAVYLDDLARLGVSQDWGLTGVSLRHGRTKELLAGQDGLYTVVQRGRQHETARVVGSIGRWHYAAEDKSAVLAALTDEATRVVTMTITGDGYCLDKRTGQFDCTRSDVGSDLSIPNHFSTTWAYLAEALSRRRRAGLRPFTVMSCDNVPDNGKAARTALVSFATLRDPSLGRWIERHVAFPSTMVDRITPVTTWAEKRFVERSFGIVDACPVTAEPFRQWIIEDTFCDGRPPLEEVGVDFVDDVSNHKLIKTRLLNGMHSAIAYLGTLAGYERVNEAVGDPALSRYLHQLMHEEVAPLLPAVSGIDVHDYCSTTLERFRNPRISDRLSRLTARGSDKMPAYLLPSLHEAIAAGRPHTLLMLAVAGWARYLRGTDLSGRDIDIQDSQADLLKTLAMLGKSYPDPLLRNQAVFGNLRLVPGFVERLGQMIDSIDTHGVATTLRRYLTEDNVRQLVGQ
jgi:mannitol 2-dehydrogenase